MATDKVKTKSKRDKKEKKDKKDKKESKDTKSIAPATLLADEKSIDTKLSSLFAVQAPVKRPELPPAPVSEDVSEDEIASEPEVEDVAPAVVEPDTNQRSRKRKRKDASDDLEDQYLRRLERETEQQQPQAKKAREIIPESGDNDAIESDDDSDGGAKVDEADEAEEEDFVPPQHESQTALSMDLDKAGRTVFVGNVAIAVITAKSARKTFEKHLASFFDQVKVQDEKTPHKLESTRFRSTPYSPSLPKKAAFARGEVMSTTAQSTNAYAVYSTAALAREACKRLNGTIVLDRHIRVDSVAHPAPIAHKRCVFVGNLGFVDDESNIIAANEAEGREKSKQNQKPSDVEEGLWRLFSKHGTVESVRVIRDKGTRVGIGIAYVQFTDENAVESALSEDGKKSPPMLPRKLRVTRAKAMKRKPVEKPQGKPEKSDGYNRKITPGEATLRGRVGKLMGTAAAAMTRRPGFQGPESFVFEGHRASSKQKNTGLRLGKKSKSKGKPTNRSAKRAAAYRANGGAKKASS